MEPVYKIKAESHEDDKDNKPEGRHELKALYRDILNYVSNVFAAIGCAFKKFIKIFQLNQIDRVSIRTEKIPQHRSLHRVSLIFESVDLYAVLHNRFLLLQSM